MSGRTTETMETIFGYILQFKRENDGCSPTLREIQAATGVASTSTVNYHLNRLEVLGRIMRKVGDSRSIQVEGGYWEYRGEVSE